jgi:MFS family permease
MAPPSARRAGHAYRWYLGSTAAWALAVAMNQMVLSWLLVGELRETAGWVGVAQTCQQLPFLVFLLPGGLLADRAELRGVLTRIFVLGALAVGGLAALVRAGWHGLPVLLPFAFAWGTLQALANPTRDAMISNLVSGEILRAVTGITLVQFVALAAGAKLGGLTQQMGNAANLALQAALLLAGALAVRRLPRVPPAGRRAGERALEGLREGLAAVRRSERLLPLALLVGANGLLFMGPYQVLGPLLVRDVYRGGAPELSLHWMVLPLGSIAGSIAMLLRGRTLPKGPALLAALVGVSLCLVGIALRPPFWGFLALVFVWGVCHALFFNTSRALFQELAVGAQRARILSVHPLGLFGMAPLSNLGSGLLADAIGAAAGCLLAGLAMLAVVAVALVITPVRGLR